MRKRLSEDGRIFCARRGRDFWVVCQRGNLISPSL